MSSHLYRIAIIAIVLAASACRPDNSPTSAVDTNAGDIEAREDSLALVEAYAAQAKISWQLLPSMETAVIAAAAEEDAADDPAFWLHPTSGDSSIIYGSNKQGGIAAYDLQGKQVAYYPVGKVNNIDVLDSCFVNGTLTSLLGGTNRTYNSIELFAIDNATGKLTDLIDGQFSIDTTSVDEVYGYTFARDLSTGRDYCIINGKNGLMQQYELVYRSEGIMIQLVRSHQFGSQPEGMVADTELGHLYVGVEQEGIWKLPINPDDTTAATMLLESSMTRNSQLSYDIEGLALYTPEDYPAGCLVASSQGNFSYAVFERQGDNTYLGSFIIADNSEIDGAEETDGLAFCSDSLSADYPNGVLIVQDGFNYYGEQLQPQNFKVVDAGQLLDSLVRM